MAKFIASTRKSMQFMSQGLWKVRINKVNKRQGLFLRQLRVFSLAIKGFKDDKCFTYATALTFYTLFSIVPVLALIFAIAKGFGYEKTLQDQILASYSQYSTVLSNAFGYANSMLATTSGGAIAGFGIVLLLWSIMQLLNNIEDSFNDVWEVQRGRSWVRKITDYLTIMLVAPLLLILSTGLTVAVETKVGAIGYLGIIGAVLVKFFAYCIVVMLFTFLYIALPNIKVHYRSGLIAAAIAALLFELVGWAYVSFQIGVNRLNAIYGGFAALPLFLIWLQYSWFIVLFGSQLSYAYQNVDSYELEEEIDQLSTRYKKAIALMIANLVARRFYNGEKPLTAVEISEKLDLPSRLTRVILNDFVTTRIFAEVVIGNDEEVAYQPGVTESQFTVKFLIDSLEKKGINTLPISDTEELLHINQLMQEMDKTMDTDLGHLLVKDIVK
jgi:membrane protein